MLRIATNQIKQKKQNGFSLLEIIVVMSILVVFFLISSNFIIRGFRALLFGYEQDSAVQNAKRITNAITGEIREASQSDRGDYLLNTVEEQNFSFFSDIDSDEHIEKVRYFLDVANGILKKGVIEPSGDPMEYLEINEVLSEIAEHINNQSEPIFTYYDTDNNLIVNPAANKKSIRLVQVFLKINVTPEIAPNDYIVEMDIHLRNLKDNL